ncbi:TPR-like protein [Piedraia hortae CBS 480.64]|uniref:TPR-like protein n=1 Tax=Piedraia hortae CBS 480.64 TaxID=1314780 RepID=A0A6A7C535_9PEZI|nr:TPR-like protein [Piedraia hortae CBS 480.64]
MAATSPPRYSRYPQPRSPATVNTQPPQSLAPPPQPLAQPQQQQSSIASPPPPPQQQAPAQQPQQPQSQQQQQQQQQQQPPKPSAIAQATATANEKVWLALGSFAEVLNHVDEAVHCYERALTCNPWSTAAMHAISNLWRVRDQFPQAIEYLRAILRIDPSNGEVWSSLGHCYLMTEDLQQAYAAYQQALYHLPDPKEPRLWYGIGILYDRYGSLEHAEEAFSQVMRMQPTFEKSNEIYFRLGIIYKQQQKYQSSLDCFQFIVNDPPRPLCEEDIWFQIGHVYEQQKDYDLAKTAYTRVLDRDPNHAKVLQQLGWLHHNQGGSYELQEQAIEYLEKSVQSDPNDAQSWYLLGRCYMSQHKYPKAYESYQQAVYRDGRNPTFWCSIGVLYYQISQYRDALDAYSRAIRLNPNISEVWYDLGTLYESCNNQTPDALDAYTRAAELDPTNTHIKARLALLKGQSTNGMPNQGVPLPQDVHPQAYQPGALGSGPPGPQWNGHSQNPPPGPAPPPLGPAGNWGPFAPTGRPSDPPLNATPSHYDQRDRLPPPQHQHAQQQQSLPPPPPTQAPRPPSAPRPDLSRYPHDQPQRPPPPPHRGLSTSPNGSHLAAGPTAATTYRPGQPVAVPPISQVHSPRPDGLRSDGLRHYGPTTNDTGTPLPPYGRPNDLGPPSEVRPLGVAVAGAPGTPYGRQPFIHHEATPGIAGGAPAPPTAQSAADAAAREREREDRRSVAPPKRPREWEDGGGSAKKPSTDLQRSRLDEIKVLRPASPERNGTPTPGRSPRRDQSYNPSEAAHHPTSLPSLTQLAVVAAPEESTQAQSQAPPPPPSQPPAGQQHRALPTPQSQTYEPAARPIKVDENYCSSSESEGKSTKEG